MSDQFETKDSGSRRSFDTGSVRDAAQGKGRYDLLCPTAILREALLFERGALKYDARNWEKGQPMSVFMDCAMRHLFKHLAGHRDEDHLAAARWNIGGVMFMEEQIALGKLPAELNDLPDHITPAPNVSTGGNTNDPKAPKFKRGDAVAIQASHPADVSHGVVMCECPEGDFKIYRGPFPVRHAYPKQLEPIPHNPCTYSWAEKMPPN